MFRTVCLFMTISLALLIASCTGGSSSTRQVTTDTTIPVTKAATYYVNVPESTAIAVTLVDSIDTDVQVTGAPFRAELSAPLLQRHHSQTECIPVQLRVLRVRRETGHRSPGHRYQLNPRA